MVVVIKIHFCKTNCQVHTPINHLVKLGQRIYGGLGRVNFCVSCVLTVHLETFGVQENVLMVDRPNVTKSCKSCTIGVPYPDRVAFLKNWHWVSV